MKAGLAVALLWAAEAARAQSAALVEPPRWYGHFIGDVLQQRIALRDAAGQAVPLAALPEPARVDAWLERRAPRLEAGWLVLEYQIVNSPPQARRVSLPALRLSGTDRRVIEVPAWPLSIAPLAVDDPAAPAPLQPLRPPPGQDEQAPLQALRHSALALGAVLLAWVMLAAFWRWRDAATQPFARARREVHRVPAGAPEAWRALHRAFEHWAGRSLHRGQLGTLFEAAPWLGAQRSQIDRFYADSALLFYGGTPPGDPALPRQLSRQLARLERHRR